MTGSRVSPLLIFSSLVVAIAFLFLRTNDVHTTTINTTDCENREPDSDCDEWAREGACTLPMNQGWMSVVCAKSCKTCHLVDFETRCARDRFDGVPALENGTLAEMFTGVAQRAGQGHNPSMLSKSPLVLTLRGFVKDEEIQALLQTAGRTFQPSTQLKAGASDAVGHRSEVADAHRQSQSTICSFSNRCKDHPIVKSLVSRIEHVMGIPSRYYEHTQLIKYEPGQYYKTHHDMSEADNKLPCGPRVLTFFMYLSDVDSGGGTNFPRLKGFGEDGLTVQPKKGDVVIWPSVLEADVRKRDNNTFHQALPVESGVKVAANIWIRLYDYESASVWGCTGQDF